MLRLMLVGYDRSKSSFLLKLLLLFGDCLSNLTHELADLGRRGVPWAELLREAAELALLLLLAVVSIAPAA